MSKDELKTWIDSLTQDITFQYLGVWGSICPFSRTEIALAYGDDAYDCDSIDAAMAFPFMAGKSLNDICEDIDFE